MAPFGRCCTYARCRNDPGPRRSSLPSGTTSSLGSPVPLQRGLTTDAAMHEQSSVVSKSLAAKPSGISAESTELAESEAVSQRNTLASATLHDFGLAPLEPTPFARVSSVTRGQGARHRRRTRPVAQTPEHIRRFSSSWSVRLFSWAPSQPKDRLNPLPFEAELEDEMAMFPVPAIPSSASGVETPLVTHEIEGVTMQGLRQALHVGEVFNQFLVQTLNCQVQETSKWRTERSSLTSRDWGGVQRTHFTFPIPHDVPKFVRRLIRLPEFVRGKLTLALTARDHEILVRQRLRFRDVPLSDRVVFDHVMCWHAPSSHSSPLGGPGPGPGPGPAGSGSPPTTITFRQWTHLCYTETLPWVYSPVTSYLETRVLGDARILSPILMDIVKQTALRMQAAVRGVEGAAAAASTVARAADDADHGLLSDPFASDLDFEIQVAV